MPENTITIPFKVNPSGHRVFDLSGLDWKDASGLIIDATVEVSQQSGLPIGSILVSTLQTCPDLGAIGYQEGSYNSLEEPVGE